MKSFTSLKLENDVLYDGEGKRMDELCDRLQMETEEVVRLANRKGIPKTEIITQAEWSKAWTPE